MTSRKKQKHTHITGHIRAFSNKNIIFGSTITYHHDFLQCFPFSFGTSSFLGGFLRVAKVHGYYSDSDAWELLRSILTTGRRGSQLLGGTLLRTKISLGCGPSQDASDHQDYEPFSVGNPELNLHLPLLLGGGHTSRYLLSMVLLSR